MTDQLSYEIQYFFSARTNLAAARRALLATHLTESTRAALEDDVVFHFNELIALEMNSDNPILRRACAAVIDGHGFDRAHDVSTVGIEL